MNSVPRFRSNVRRSLYNVLYRGEISTQRGDTFCRSVLCLFYSVSTNFADTLESSLDKVSSSLVKYSCAFCVIVVE